MDYKQKFVANSWTDIEEKNLRKQVHKFCHYNCVNYMSDLIRCSLSQCQAPSFHISCCRAPWLSQAPVPCGQPGWPHGPDSSSVLPPGAERCPSPNGLAKAEPDLLRTKVKQRKWTHNKRAICTSLSICLPLRLTAMAASLDSRASPHAQWQLLTAECSFLGTT